MSRQAECRKIPATPKITKGANTPRLKSDMIVPTDRHLASDRYIRAIRPCRRCNQDGAPERHESASLPGCRCGTSSSGLAVRSCASPPCSTVQTGKARAVPTHSLLVEIGLPGRRGWSRVAWGRLFSRPPAPTFGRQRRGGWPGVRNSGSPTQSPGSPAG
jgi:hypothetical protein